MLLEAVKRAAERAKASGSDYFVLVEDQRPMRIILKIAAASWLSYGLGKVLWSYDTMFLDSSLKLAASPKPPFRAEGIRRMSNWHTSDTVTQKMVERGGVDVCLSALHASEPAVRLSALTVLARMAALEPARDSLVERDVLTKSLSCCDTIGLDHAEQCHSHVQRLSAALKT
ncbi:hypothetical protein AB1Y20_020124 [Prymnesium parvum]|uniref:HEAT repeat domain-containing protein n=1 Tax=Prymnesium parvum TaxID=97485 RepID=A0AB34JU85_PRYPA